MALVEIGSLEDRPLEEVADARQAGLALLGQREVGPEELLGPQRGRKLDQHVGLRRPIVPVVVGGAGRDGQDVTRLEGEAPAAHTEAWRPAEHLETGLLDAVDVLGADDAPCIHTGFELDRLTVGVGGMLEEPDALPVDRVGDPGTLHGGENGSIFGILRPVSGLPPPCGEGGEGVSAHHRIRTRATAQ